MSQHLNYINQKDDGRSKCIKRYHKYMILANFHIFQHITCDYHYFCYCQHTLVCDFILLTYLMFWTMIRSCPFTFQVHSKIWESTSKNFLIPNQTFRAAHWIIVISIITTWRFLTLKHKQNSVLFTTEKSLTCYSQVLLVKNQQLDLILFSLTTWKTVQ